VDRSPAEALRRFRARFDGVAEAERADEEHDAPTPEIRMLRVLELHGLALAMEIEQARARLGTTLPDRIASEVDRRWIDEAPVPVALAARWRALHGDPPR